MTNSLRKKLTFEEVVQVAINSVADGYIDRTEAIKMVKEAATEDMKDLENIVLNTVSTLDRAVEECWIDARYPLDEIILEEAYGLYQEKGMLLYCRSGHAVTMFRETQETNEVLAMCQ